MTTPSPESATRPPATAGVVNTPGMRSGRDQDAQRDAQGRFLPGNQVAYRHGVKLFERRAELPSALRDALDGFRDALVADQGGYRELTTVRQGYVERLVATEGVLRLLEGDLAQRGMLTPKGRVRSTYTAWLAALDRWDRLAQRLGLDRRASKVPTLDAYLAQRKDER